MQNLVLSGIALAIIIGLVVAMALPNYIDGGPSPVVACQSGLKLIDGAKASWALDYHKASEDIPTDEDLFGLTKYSERKPACPLGGTYTLGKVREKPRCSIPGHTI